MQWTSEAANAGVIDENIKSAESLLDVGGCGFDGAQVCNIAFECLGSAPGFRNGVGGGLQMLLGAPAKDRRSPHGCNFSGNGSANAAAGPGNDGNLASQNGIIALFRGFHVILRLYLLCWPCTTGTALTHILTRRGGSAGQSALALVELHTYNPAHRKTVIQPVRDYRKGADV